MAITKIGFKNFKKFEEFPPIELGNLNIFVGKNNSGKSTTIKALMFAQWNAFRLMDSRSRGTRPYASFLVGDDSHLHIGDYSSCKNEHSNREMEFTIKSEDCEINFVLDGSHVIDNDPSLSVPFKKITISGEDCSLFLSMEEDNTRSSLSCNELFLHRLIDRLSMTYSRRFGDIDALMSDRLAWEEGRADFREPAKAERFRKLIKLLKNKLGGPNDQVPNPITIDLKDADIFYMYNRGFGTELEDGEYLGLLVQEVLASFKKASRMPSYVFHVETHSASHNELLYTEDKNDYLTLTVLEYLSQGTRSKDEIKKWLKEFEIGDDFRISRPYNEALYVEIHSKGRWRPLGQMGTGSIQMFILLLRISIALESHWNSTIIVEEPEQNLHPALQSKLADMFLEISRSSRRVQFIIESHSEYLVRRTQVHASRLISRGKSADEVNRQMKVYYFDEDSVPYSMEYMESGHFERKFGSGFFDEAGKSYMELLSNQK